LATERRILIVGLAITRLDHVALHEQRGLFKEESMLAVFESGMSCMSGFDAPSTVTEEPSDAWPLNLSSSKWGSADHGDAALCPGCR
jgi:hypothetical protein